MKINMNSSAPIKDGRYQARKANHPRALTASAVRINLKDPREQASLHRRVTRKNSWQAQAWDYYDYIGTIKFSANLIANTLSKIRIFPAYSASDDVIPSAVRHYPEIEEYAPIIEEVFSLLNTNQGGISGYLRTAALSQFIAGEHFLVQEPGNALYGRQERYTLRSIDEIHVEPGRSKDDPPQLFIKPEPDTPKEEYIPLPPDCYIARMWRPHPRYSNQADSSMRGILDDADDYLTYSREGRILSRSRSSASILFIPDSLDDSAYPDDPTTEDPENEDGSDDQHDSVAEHITLALNEQAFQDEHVNHYAPIILRGPAEAGRDIRFIDMNRTMDNLHAKLIEDKMDIILSALDIPKDLAKGLSDLKYNSGALIEDSLYNSHVEPLILLIVDQLTTGFLRPALRAQGIPEEVIEKVLVWYNPSAIMAKPAKAQSADFGYENNLLSGRAWRDAKGYNDSDQPSQREIARKMLLEKINLDPNLANTLLATLMPEVMEATRETTRSDLDPESLDDLNSALGTADTTPGEIMDSGTDMTLDPSAPPQDDLDNVNLDAAARQNTQEAPAGLMEP